MSSLLVKNALNGLRFVGQVQTVQQLGAAYQRDAQGKQKMRHRRVQADCVHGACADCVAGDQAVYDSVYCIDDNQKRLIRKKAEEEPCEQLEFHMILILFGKIDHGRIPCQT